MRPERLTVLFLGVLSVACSSSEDSVGNCSAYKPYDEVVDLSEAGVPDAGGTPDAGDDAGSAFFCANACPPNPDLDSCEVNGTTVTCHYNPICPGGRRPEGYQAPDVGACDDERAFFAQMAHLEHASVGAFGRLRRELHRYRAPRSLLRAIERSARDEVRHHRVMRSLARRRGSSGAHAPPAPASVRRLEDIALENAIEGCVHETYGALVAQLQASRATNPEVRATMARVARDETRHAALAWRIASWLDRRLTPAARDRVRRARAEAARALATRARVPDFAAARATLGLPDPDEAERMVRELDARLWS